MSDKLLLAVAVGVFLLLLLGIGLTIYEFHRAGCEPVERDRKRDRRR
ncbi:hypothetical protein [Microbulbifer sp. SAOS-129_SWC]